MMKAIQEAATKRGALLQAASATVVLGLGALLAGCDEPRVDPEELGIVGLSEEELELNETLEDPAIYQVPAEPEEEVEFVLNEGAQVSVLGYHDFSDRKSTAMIMTADKFRAQMQAVADAELPVISMDEFLAWRRGESNIPDYSVMITIDDGWLGTHSYALPVLKEFGFPFTCFLYTNYVGIGGRSLSLKQVRELIEAGAEIGSHSISHAAMTRRGNRSDEEYARWLQDEFVESRKWLEEKFGVDVRTFAYPFGSYNDAIAQLGLELDYEALFTVNGAKVRWDTPIAEIGRFIVHGNHEGNFDLATTFRGRGALVASEMLVEMGKEQGPEGEGPKVGVRPGPDSTIAGRMPRIEADLSAFQGVDPESVELSLTGMGPVAVKFDGERNMAYFQVPFRLRNTECRVVLAFEHGGQKETVSWKFGIDPYPLYLTGGGATEQAAVGQ